VPGKPFNTSSVGEKSRLNISCVFAGVANKHLACHDSKKNKETNSARLAGWLALCVSQIMKHVFFLHVLAFEQKDQVFTCSMRAHFLALYTALVITLLHFPQSVFWSFTLYH
jgi:hypothetical protein